MWVLTSRETARARKRALRARDTQESALAVSPGRRVTTYLAPPSASYAHGVVDQFFLLDHEKIIAMDLKKILLVQKKLFVTMSNLSYLF